MRKLAHEIYSFDEFRLDLTRGALFRGPDEVKLRPKSFDVLKYLIENPGRLLSKDELIESIWEGIAVTDGSLVQCLKDIRHALGDTEQKIIKTVPRRGYIFDKEVSGNSAGMHAEEVSGVEETDHRSGDKFALDSLSKAKTLFGREKEIAAIKKMLRRDDVRLVTLTGTGGTGKTILAQAVLDDCRPEFSDGAFFVDLAAVNDPELIASAIATTLGVKESSGKTLVENLINFLRDKRVLLVLDNFEQIIPAADLLPKFTDALPKLKILVTSRVPLHLPDEYELGVPPLAVPPGDQSLTIDDLENYSAVKLFIARAQGAKPAFVFNEENASAVAQICARLDGLPLAIELAAARVKLLSPTVILGRLENSLKLLTSRTQGLPDRQRAMRDVVEWSYDLLDEDEKELFKSLAVFAGGFTVEAAESIIQIQCDGGRRNEISVLDLIESLIDKNLLVAQERPGAETRGRMLEVIREFAVEKLENRGDASALRNDHAQYFLKIAEKAGPDWQTEHAVEWLNRLEDENDNLRAALSWFLEHDKQQAARLAAAILPFWNLHAYLTEGRTWLTAVLKSVNGDSPTGIYCKLLNGLGEFARRQGDFDTAREAYENALTSAGDDKRQIALSNRGLGMVSSRQGHFKAGRAFFMKSFEITRELNDESELAYSLTFLGDLAWLEGERATARIVLKKSLALARELGNKEVQCSGLNSLGAFAYIAEDLAAARSYFWEALVTATELGDKVIIAFALDGFAALAVKEVDELERAARLAGAAEQLRGSVGAELELAQGSFRDAYVAEIKSKMDEAEFAKLFDAGRKLKPDEAIALANR